MEFRIEPYTQERIGDVLAFERQLRREEDFWGWEIDSAYEEAVRKSFEDRRFDAAVSLLAYDGDRVRLRDMGVSCLVGLMAQNEEAQLFYRSLENADIHDEGIWIDL